MNTTPSPSRSRSDQEMVSPLARPVPRAANSDYAELKRLLKDRGLLDKQPVYYLWRIALLLALLAGGNLLIGMSYAWWQEKHNRHHSHPNQVGMDPDIVDSLSRLYGHGPQQIEASATDCESLLPGACSSVP